MSTKGICSVLLAVALVVSCVNAEIEKPEDNIKYAGKHWGVTSMLSWNNISKIYFMHAQQTILWYNRSMTNVNWIQLIILKVTKVWGHDIV